MSEQVWEFHIQGELLWVPAEMNQIVSFNKNDLMKFRNFGKKSLTELDELVAAKGLNFGMDLGKYKLDKE